MKIIDVSDIPEDVIKAAKLVEDYANEQGWENWELMGIRQRFPSPENAPEIVNDNSNPIEAGEAFERWFAETGKTKLAAEADIWPQLKEDLRKSWMACAESAERAIANFRRPLPAAPASVEGETPKVVCLCGSSKFPEAHMRAMMAETLAGRIVIPMGLYGHADFPEGAKAATNDGDEATAVKQMLDTLHWRKIDLADEILVVSVGGYFGSSTQREIEYAEKAGKVVRRYNEPTHFRLPDSAPGTETPNRIALIRDALRDSAELINHKGGNGKLARKAIGWLDEVERELATVTAESGMTHLCKEQAQTRLKACEAALEERDAENDRLRAEVATLRALLDEGKGQSAASVLYETNVALTARLAEVEKERDELKASVLRIFHLVQQLIK